MSTKPTGNLVKWWPAIPEEPTPYETSIHTRLLFNSANDHDQAITLLKQQIDAMRTQAGNTTIINSSSTSGGGGGGGNLPGLGAVNNLQGDVTYTNQPSDNGALLLFGDASPVAVQLSAGVQAPYFFYAENWGAGLVTFTPSMGTISSIGNPGAASMTLAEGYRAMLVFDGTNWWAATLPMVPVSIAAVAHEFLTAYDAATGAFTAAQPAFADISGVAAVGQIPQLPESQITNLTSDLAAKAPLASPTFTGTVTQPTPDVLTGATTATSATAGTASALPSAPLGYLEMSVNGTTVKLPYYSV